MSEFEYDEPVVVQPGEAIKFKSDPEGIEKLFEEVLNVVPKASCCSDSITPKKGE